MNLSCARGRQHEENFQKTSWKTIKYFSVTRPASFSFVKLFFSVLFDRFVVFTSCKLNLEVSQQNTNPHPEGKFFVDLNGLGILRLRLLEKTSLDRDRQHQKRTVISVLIRIHSTKIQDNLQKHNVIF